MQTLYDSTLLFCKKRKEDDILAAARDMTKGSPLKIMLGFTVPVLIGNIFQQLYSMDYCKANVFA